MRRHTLGVERMFAPACLALGLLMAGCMGSAGNATQPPFCDGITAEVGGCDEDQPTYTGTTCAELAREWGDEVDRRLTAVIDGPAVDGEAKSVQQSNVLVLTSTRLSMYMDRTGLLDSCDLREFLPIAEEQFSDKLREGVDHRRRRARRDVRGVACRLGEVHRRDRQRRRHLAAFLCG